MPARRLALPLLLAALLVTAGCLGTVEFHTLPDSDPEAVDFVERSAAASRNVSGVEYTVGGQAVVTEDDRRERTIEFDGNGSANVSARHAHVRIVGGDDAEEHYVDGYTAYSLCPRSKYVNVEDAWLATDLPENRSWLSFTPLGGLDHVLAISKAYDRGTATVHGEQVREVVLRPNPAKLHELRSRAIYPGGDRPNRGRVENVTVTLWLDADSALPRKVAVERVSSKRGVRLEERLIYEFSYGPRRVDLPNRTVETKDDCPEPS
jgi:hypothetical protein